MFTTWTILRLFFRVRVVGLERIAKTGPVLILPKHQRLMDIPLGFTYVIQAARPDAWCLMKETLSGAAGFLLKCGGIPLNRKNPEKSKDSLLMARSLLHAGEFVCLFPEQTYWPGRMGRGKVPGFRFVCGKPQAPIQVVALGIEYRPRRFRRTEVWLRLGEAAEYTADSDPDLFLYDRMCEIGELSGGMPYPYERPTRDDRESPRS